MSTSFVYITTRDRSEATVIGRTLVLERLAASVNILGGVNSIYRWQGELHEADEAVLLVKTRTELVELLIQRVRELHSYECPCIVAGSITQGHPPYLQWISEQTQPEAS